MTIIDFTLGVLITFVLVAVPLTVGFCIGREYQLARRDPIFYLFVFICGFGIGGIIAQLITGFL